MLTQLARRMKVKCPWWTTECPRTPLQLGKMIVSLWSKGTKPRRNARKP